MGSPFTLGVRCPSRATPTSELMVGNRILAELGYHLPAETGLHPTTRRRRNMTKPAKTRGPGKRYTPAEKAKILAAAKAEGLTGDQVARKFGVASLTFYRWRGPVRSDALKRRGKRGPGRPPGSGNAR